MAKSPEEITADMVAGLKEKTGKDLAAWQKILKASGLSKHGEMLKHLKSEHGVTHGFANLIVHKTLNSDAGSADGDDLIAAQYAGPKAGLRPLYDALLKFGLRVAPDVKACPCKTMVPLFRNHVIAQIKPATRTRIDLGLALAPHVKAGGKVPARLIDTGGLAKKDRITHRFAIESADDIDGEVETWLRRAYELDV